MALSTLTTRLFDQPGSAMAYKEPILLSQLAKLERAGLLSDGDSDALMALLFRPFDGDPVLMGMIRASHLGDSNGIAQLGQRVVCDPRAAR